MWNDRNLMMWRDGGCETVAMFFIVINGGDGNRWLILYGIGRGGERRWSSDGAGEGIEKEVDVVEADQGNLMVRQREGGPGGDFLEFWGHNEIGKWARCQGDLIWRIKEEEEEERMEWRSEEGINNNGGCEWVSDIVREKERESDGKRFQLKKERKRKRVIKLISALDPSPSFPFSSHPSYLTFLSSPRTCQYCMWTVHLSLATSFIYILYIYIMLFFEFN